MGAMILNSIHEGWKWSDDPGKDLLSRSLWEQIGQTLNLSDRELQVCKLLFCGHTREEIADQLSIKPRTVRQYMEQTHVKLRVKNRVGLVLRIVQVRDYLKGKK